MPISCAALGATEGLVEPTWVSLALIIFSLISRPLTMFYSRVREQLWTNDGRYKTPSPGQEYPADLAVSVTPPLHVCLILTSSFPS